MAESTAPSTLRFGSFAVDLKAAEVLKNGRKVKLQEKPFQLLILLLERAGEVVTREELRSKLWPADTFVDFDHSLGTAMGKLRLALGDSAGEPRFIQTLPRRGYRFIAQVVSSGELVSYPKSGSMAGNQVNGSREAAKRDMAFRSRRKLATATGVALAALALVLLAGIVPGVRDRLTSWAGTARIRSIAVLPFENLSHDPEQDYFAEGITDELIASLARIPGLRVISRTSSMFYRGKHLPLARIARELKVDGVLEGTLRRSGSRVRVTVQLIQAPEERHLWAESYEHDSGDLLTLQAVLAEAIANEIRVKTTLQREARFAPMHHVDPDGYEAYLKGRYYENRLSVGDLTRAVENFERAIQKNPNYAPAYAGLADCYFRLANDRVLTTREGYGKSKEAALRALAVDDSLGEAHTALGRVLFQHDWNWAAAEKEFKRGVELSPSSAPGRIRYAIFLIAMGRSDEARVEGKKACALDPVSHSTCSSLGDLYYLSHQFDDAIAAWRRTLELYPDSGSEHLSLSRVFWKQGLERESRAELLKAEQLWGADEEALSIYRNAYAASGMTGIWRKELELAHYEHPFDFAMLYTQLGNKDRSFQWLERAFQEREYRMVFIKMNPLLDGLHSDSRFQDLVRRVGLPQ